MLENYRSSKSIKRRALIILIFILFPFPLLPRVGAQANISQDEEFLPLSKRHLRGRKLEARDFKPSADAEEQKPVVDLRSLLSEFQRARNEGPIPSARSGNSFKDTIGSVRIEGRFEVLNAHTAVSDNYLRTVERTIRGNIFPPIIARTMPQASTVAITFVVRKDGTISDIEKETSTGSPALDATAISACRSSSPLPALEVNVDEVIRMRFTLTFNPEP